MSNDHLKPLAKDLTTEYPRSPRDTLAGYVIAARMLDKCRATVNGCAGEYRFDCRLDRHFLEFTGIEAEQFKAFVGTGASDAQVAEWITRHARPRTRVEIIRWNNRMRELRISDLPPEAQEFLEDYIPKFVPKNRVPYVWFDVYDLEEQRL